MDTFSFNSLLASNSILFYSKDTEVATRGVLQNFTKFTGKHLCQSLFIKKETLAQVFSCEFCKIFKNTFSTEHLWMTTSEDNYIKAAYDYQMTSKMIREALQGEEAWLDHRKQHFLYPWKSNHSIISIRTAMKRACRNHHFHSLAR